MPIFDTDPTPVQTPTYIGEIRYDFTDANGTPAGYTSHVVVQVLDQDSAPITIKHVRNLSPHLTATERGQLMAIFNRLRNEAVKELL